MTIMLDQSHMQLLEDAVASGQFTSVKDAAAYAISQMFSIGEDELDWAKPAVDEALREELVGVHASGEMVAKRLREDATRLAKT